MKDTQSSSRLAHDRSSNGLPVSTFHHRGNSMTKHFRITGCLLCASLFSSLAYGQADSAAIVGTVIDYSGAVLPNGVVTIINLGTNAKTVVKTGADCSYIATPQKIGNYTVG